MKANWSRIAFVGCLALLLAACNKNQVIASSMPDETMPPTAATLAVVDAEMGPLITLSTQKSEKDGPQITPPAPAGPPSGIESVIEKAKDDLAQRLAISVAQITLVEAKEVVWPDSSLGCPQPGMEYLQVPEDGAQILLQAQEKVYDYHVGGARGLFLCENASGSPYPPPAAPAAPAVQSPYP